MDINPQSENKHLITTAIVARDLPDAWFQCIYEMKDSGRIYTIDRGSNEGQQRQELDFITVHILNPGVRPLIPDIPEHLGIPNPVEEGYIEDYLPYLMSSTPIANEDYTYGQFLENQIAEVINRKSIFNLSGKSTVPERNRYPHQQWQTPLHGLL